MTANPTRTIRPVRDLSATQVAARLSVDRGTVWRWWRRGLFPGAWRTPGGHLRIPPSDVERVRGR